MLVNLLDILTLAFDMNPTGLSVAYMLSVVYGFISPVLMVKYMPGLRTAVVNILPNISHSEVKLNPASGSLPTVTERSDKVATDTTQQNIEME